MYSTSLIVKAGDFLAAARAQKLRVATAESCTGGLISGLLTEIAGSSDVFSCGLVVYANDAKQRWLGVPQSVLETHGAVSAECARAMVEGVLANTPADLAVAVTGIAGPGGGTKEKPVGLVYFGAARRGRDAITDEQRFGALTRRDIRLRSVENALALLTAML